MQVNKNKGKPELSTACDQRGCCQASCQTAGGDIWNWYTSRTRGIRRQGVARNVPGRLLRLLDLKQLDVELQGAVGGDAGKTLGAVGKVGGDGQTTLAADGHALETDIPALDDLSLACLEGERLALLVGCDGKVSSRPRFRTRGCNLPSKTLPFSSLPM